MFSMSEHLYMAKAIELAKQGHFTTSPNPRVGCVIVQDNVIIGQGFHQKAGTGHAEVNAIADAKQKGHSIKGATAYVTLEPCSHFGRTPPCAKALTDVGVGKVISAMVDPNPQVSGRGLAMLEAAGITTLSGLLEADAKALNPGFITLMTNSLPYVRCKLATSLDGKTAMASGESQWITSSEARRDVQRLRAQSCAIITGADSVIIDKANMTVRHAELGELKAKYKQADVRQPTRVVIDSQQRLTPDLPLFKSTSPIIIIGTDVENIHQWPHFVEHITVASTPNGKADLKEVLKSLGQRGFNDVFIEAGARLAGAFIEQDLVDELIHYQAPKLMGSDGKSMVTMPSVVKLNQAKNVNISDICMVGPDIKITVKLQKS